MITDFESPRTDAAANKHLHENTYGPGNDVGRTQDQVNSVGP